MNIEIIKPNHQLKDHVELIFIFTGKTQPAKGDLKTIVPNGRIKLIIPIENGLVANINGWHHRSKQNKLTLTGIGDIPAQVDFETRGPASNITFEFSPLGAYRFFKLKWYEIKNQVHTFSDISSIDATRLEERLLDTVDVHEKVNLIQQFLITQLKKNPADPIFDFCVQKIIATNGRVTIAELEKGTGYSARWLNMKFSEKLGVGPKNLSSIIRFQQYYGSLKANAEKFFFEKKFYSYYYDQAHFIKDFKRFTGYAPVEFERLSNAYDAIFYKG